MQDAMTFRAEFNCEHPGDPAVGRGARGPVTGVRAGPRVTTRGATACGAALGSLPMHVIFSEIHQSLKRRPAWYIREVHERRCCCFFVLMHKSEFCFCCSVKCILYKYVRRRYSHYSTGEKYRTINAADFLKEE